jgi:hypothetical protein
MRSTLILPLIFWVIASIVILVIRQMIPRHYGYVSARITPMPLGQLILTEGCG